ncbi:sigma-70 family RNA polymerase sigma factor [Actinomadura syzygii]|uniref:Sigma-70 family RNA polymerase sigma factor n=2 Tax=Actinomadura syzygii TaxID=1427538 RepID=A0A5D0TZS0_9ACTN|nr:sigma-70 family RNA polymerase sigma factor [Actinomadura syzygii]
MLLAYATRLTGDRAAAEDLVQETLIRAWKHVHIVATATIPLTGWLLTILRNLAFDRARRQATRPLEVPELPEAGSAGGAAAGGDHSDRVVDSIVVVEALKSLPELHSSMLIEVYYRNRSVAEVAKQFQIPQGTVKSRTHYALRALRNALATHGEE